MDFLMLMLWWFVIFVIGLIFLPICLMIFSKFFDKGYMFAKTLGIAITSYLLWVMSSLRLLPFTRISILIILLFSIALVIGLLYKNKKLLNAFKSRVFVRSIVFEEIIFFICIAFWAFLRGLKPEIQGLEKFMNLGFINSILRTSYMPPLDMWFAGEYINYYYYGHYMTAFLTKLSGISSYITYNLMMSTLFAFTVILPFSIVSNIIHMLKKSTMTLAVTGGLVSSFLLALGGNLHVIVFGYILPAMKQLGFKFNEALMIRSNYWFPEATRYIGNNPDAGDKTIHEFPLYSYIVSDLHAHVLNIPFVLTLIAIVFSFVLWVFYTGRDKIMQGEKPYGMISGHIVLTAFLIGLFQITNFWDFPIYLTVFLITISYIYIIKYGISIKMILSSAAAVVGVMILSMLVAYPFSYKFNNFSNGIGFTPTHSAIYQLLIVWGHFLFFAVWYIYYLVKGKHVKNQVSQNRRKSSKKLSDSIAEWLKNLEPSQVFVLILSISALGLILIPEIVYVKDIYSPPHHRANTMFKLTYQSFIMLGLAAGFIITQIFYGSKSTIGHKVNYNRTRVITKVMAVMFVVLPMVYSLNSIKPWYGELKAERYQQLDGMMFLDQKYPGDYEAVKWLNNNLEEQAVILEAFGDSYTFYGRISMATGLPTILGWYVHEWLWRNDNQIVAQRADEVRRIYESDDIEIAKQIIEKYKIKYIIIGSLEKEKFSDLNEELILSLGNKVFESHGTKIIKLLY